VAAAVDEIVPVFVTGHRNDRRGHVVACPCFLVFPVTGYTIHVTRDLPIHVPEQLALFVGQTAEMIELEIKVVPPEVIPDAVAVGNELGVRELLVELIPRLLGQLG